MKKYIALFSSILVLAACSPTVPPSSQPQQTPQNTQEAPAKKTGFYGYIKGVNINGQKAIQFDEAEMLTGKEAQDAAKQDGLCGNQFDPIPACGGDSFYIRNNDKTAKTMNVSNNAVVEIIGTNPDGSLKQDANGEFIIEKLSLDQFKTKFDAQGYYKESPYNIVVEGIEVTKMTQQYLP